MKKIIITVVVLIAVFVLYYLISPIFNTKEVNDAVPGEFVAMQEDGDAQEDELFRDGSEKLSEQEKAEMARQIFIANKTKDKPMDDKMEMAETIKSASAPVKIQSTIGHPASGAVRVFTGEEGEIVRFEDFKTINGPKLNVYLAKDLNAEEFIDLGPIRGTTGDINYEVPAGTDLSEYKYVMHWCVTFGVLFNYAELL